jgi:hypothetical protein
MYTMPATLKPTASPHTMPFHPEKPPPVARFGL